MQPLTERQTDRPGFEKFEAAEREQRLKAFLSQKRKQLLTALADEAADGEAKAKRQRTAMAKAEQELREARDNLAAAQQRLEHARGALMPMREQLNNITHSSAHRRARLLKELRDYQPLVAEFIQRLNIELRKIEDMEPERLQFKPRGLDSMAPPITISNAESIGERRRGLLETIRIAESADIMTIGDDAELTAKLDELYASLPTIEPPQLPAGA